MFHPLIRVSIRLKVQINVVDAKKICTKIKLDEKWKLGKDEINWNKLREQSNDKVWTKLWSWFELDLTTK